jgi:hypothetical protein
MKRLCILGVFVVVGGFVGCGSTSDDEAPAIPLSQVPSLYAGAICAAYEACVGPLLDLYLAEECVELTEPRISDELSRIQQAVDDGKVRYDGTKMQACVDALKKRGCSLDREVPECTAAIEGTVALGESCTMNVECAGDAYCNMTASCPGTCERRANAGTACAGDEDCASGLQCSDTTQLCFVPAGAGDRCGGGTAPDCEPDLFCLGSDPDAGQEGNCRSIAEAFKATEGQPCILGGAPFCEFDLRCVIDVDATSQITTSCGRPVTSAAACKTAIPDMCPIDQYCAVPVNQVDGVCTAKPGNGQPCAQRGNDTFCAPGTRCDGGTCRSLQRLGGTCQTDEVCYSTRCENNGCVSASSCQ